MAQHSEIKQKILSIIRAKGPGLPVQIAREAETSALFASAFLSELISEKKVILSHMKVGNSPLYLLPGQEHMLERFSEYIGGREKEALDLLKKSRFLKDSEQAPAVRVALRQIRDFAKPFRVPGSEEIFWRYFTVRESEFTNPKVSEEKKIIVPEAPKPESHHENQDVKEKTLGIFDESHEEIPDEKPKIKAQKEKSKGKKSSKKKAVSSKKEKFFNQVKEHLDKNSVTLKDIASIGSNYLVLLIQDNGADKILVAFNKKRLNEADFARASKISREKNLPYVLLSKGGPMKKIENLIEDLKNLSGFLEMK